MTETRAVYNAGEKKKRPHYKAKAARLRVAVYWLSIALFASVFANVVLILRR